jgi:hypothetical protein
MKRQILHKIVIVVSTVTILVGTFTLGYLHGTTRAKAMMTATRNQAKLM